MSKALGHIIGIDCATEEKKTGLALGSVSDNGRVIILEALVGHDRLEKVAGWVKEHKPALLALDAPLGWPEKLARTLPNHYAGKSLKPHNHRKLFSRLTDRKVYEDLKLRNKPLEVGANLIARTAYYALNFLEDLRRRTKLAIPLIWKMGELKETSAIEVYPTATLAARDKEKSKYKDNGKRLLLLKELGVSVNQKSETKIKEDLNVFDAVICVLAGADFILGKCVAPEPDRREIAHKEGWIWFKSKRK